MSLSRLNDIETAAFERDGYIVVRNMVPQQRCGELRRIATDHLIQLIAPIEYEVVVGYPGAPTNMSSPGSDASRRLLQAFARDEAYRLWALDPEVKRILACLLQTKENLFLSQCHHNCIMTKEPGYSSVTLWHQDSRYWAFDYENLVSVWLALGKEDETNGCLRVIPGSHKLDLDSGRFDASIFLRPDLSENKLLIDQAVTVELDPGDVLFFHSRLFHAAGRNPSDETKFSVVFTYHQASNKPIKSTRSARFPSIVM